ncbi:MAG: hypothetical protein ACTSX7_07905 [Alphaproteobacteria bacterium]
MRLLILALVTSLAVATGMPSQAQMPELEPTQIENFLDALPELRTLGGRIEPDKFAHPDPGDPAAPFAPLITFIALSGAMDDATAIAGKHGFDSLADWTEIGNRTMRAYATYQAGAELGEAGATIAAAAASIRDDTTLTPEQQEIMLRHLEMATGTVLRFQSPPQDVAAIDPYLEAIRRLFE